MRRSSAIFSVYMPSDHATTSSNVTPGSRDAGHFSTTARRVNSPTWGPPPPCKQALTPVSPSQMHARRTSTAETADSSTNKNASRGDSSDTTSLPGQNPRMTSSADPVTLPTSSPVTRTRSGRVVNPNTLLRDIYPLQLPFLL